MAVPHSQLSTVDFSVVKHIRCGAGVVVMWYIVRSEFGCDLTAIKRILGQGLRLDMKRSVVVSLMPCIAFTPFGICHVCNLFGLGRILTNQVLGQLICPAAVSLESPRYMRHMGEKILIAR